MHRQDVVIIHILDLVSFQKLQLALLLYVVLLRHLFTLRRDLGPLRHLRSNLLGARCLTSAILGPRSVPPAARTIHLVLLGSSSRASATTSSRATIALEPCRDGSAGHPEVRIDLASNMITIQLLKLLISPIARRLKLLSLHQLLLLPQVLIRHRHRPIDIQGHLSLLLLLLLLCLLLHRDVPQKIAPSDLERHALLDVLLVEAVVDRLRHAFLFGFLHVNLNSLRQALPFLHLAHSFLVFLDIQCCSLLLLILTHHNTGPKMLTHILNKMPAISNQAALNSVDHRG